MTFGKRSTAIGLGAVPEIFEEGVHASSARLDSMGEATMQTVPEPHGQGEGTGAGRGEV